LTTIVSRTAHEPRSIDMAIRLRHSHQEVASDPSTCAIDISLSGRCSRTCGRDRRRCDHLDSTARAATEGSRDVGPRGATVSIWPALEARAMCGNTHSARCWTAAARPIAGAGRGTAAVGPELRAHAAGTTAAAALLAAAASWPRISAAY
jgi:hypothetical protein